MIRKVKYKKSRVCEKMGEKRDREKQRKEGRKGVRKDRGKEGTGEQEREGRRK